MKQDVNKLNILLLLPLPKSFDFRIFLGVYFSPAVTSCQACCRCGLADLVTDAII